MLKYLSEKFPAEKEKRILVSGEGQEALLVTYYLAKNERLRAGTQNLQIYLVRK